MKHTKFLSLVFSILFIFTVTGCNNLVENETVRGDEKKEKAAVLLLIDDYNSALNTRTILPSQETGTDISKIILTGTMQNNSETVEKNWTSCSQMSSEVFELTPGIWSFTLNTYKKEQGEDKLFASGILTKNLDVTSVETLLFNLSFENNTLATGNVSINVTFPLNLVTKVQVSMYQYDASYNKQNPVLEKLITPETNSFTINQTGLPKGNYFFQMDFYTDNTNNPTATRVQTVKIAGGQTSKAELEYTDDLNKNYTIVFHTMLPETEVPETEVKNLIYNSSTNIVLPQLQTTYRDFKGWYENSDYSGSSISQWSAGDRKGEINLFAKWEGKSFEALFFDFAGGQEEGKSYSGKLSGNYKYGEKIPVTDEYDTNKIILEDNNEIEFSGFYKDKYCTVSSPQFFDESIMTDSDGDEKKDSYTLYAKWNYKYVYLSPDSSSTEKGNDSNKGINSSDALLTMDEAKKYMENNSKGEVVYLVTGLSVVSGKAENNPSDLTTEKYNNAILKRHRKLINDSMICFGGGDVTIKNVTIDGGAVWGISGPEGENSGVTATCPAVNDIANNKKTIRFEGKVVIQNNDSTGGVDSAGGMYTSNLTKYVIDSQDFVVRANKGVLGGGIQLKFTSSDGFTDILEMKKGQIGGSNKTDGNYSTQNGGGIYLCSSLPDSQLNEQPLSARLNIDSESRLTVENNKAEFDGGGIYIEVGMLQLGGVLNITGNKRGNTDSESNIYLNNQNTSAVLQLAALPVCDTGKSQITSINLCSYPEANYDTDDSSTYVQVLYEQSGAELISKVNELIGVERSGYCINRLGQVVYSTEIPETGGGLIYSEDNISIETSVKAVSSANGGTINISAYADKNQASQINLIGCDDVSDWNIQLYNSQLIEITGNSYFEIKNTANEKSVGISSGLPVGTIFNLYVSFKYNGKSYGGSFAMKVEE